MIRNLVRLLTTPLAPDLAAVRDVLRRKLQGYACRRAWFTYERSPDRRAGDAVDAARASFKAIARTFGDAEAEACALLASDAAGWRQAVDDVLAAEAVAATTTETPTSP